jgi:predicted DCC family thiol-disulfide oxidoreductase YuxK
MDMAPGDATHKMAPREAGSAPRGPAGTPSEPAAARNEPGARNELTNAPSELPVKPLVLYDGTCGLCARSVRWILEHECDHEIVFAPLQGPTAARARLRYPQIPASIDTVVYIAGGRAHLRSKAFLHAANHLRAPWRWGYAMRWFPGFVLDLVYRIVAAVRYRIWGHADACGLVTPEQRTRFLP